MAMRLVGFGPWSQMGVLKCTKMTQVHEKMVIQVGRTRQVLKNVSFTVSGNTPVWSYSKNHGNVIEICLWERTHDPETIAGQTT